MSHATFKEKGIEKTVYAQGTKPWGLHILRLSVATFVLVHIIDISVG